MIRRWRGLGLVALGCVLAVAAASAKSKTKMVDATSDAPPPEPARKILVIAVTNDPITRAAFEDVIAGELSLRGTVAVASHVPFPDYPKERAPFEAKLTAEGFDAVTVSRLVDATQKTKEKAGYSTYATDYQGNYWGWYTYTCQAVLVPSYLETSTRVTLRTDLWRTTGQGSRVVWSGTSRTIDPRNAAQASREVGTAVANALVKAKLI